MRFWLATGPFTHPKQDGNCSVGRNPLSLDDAGRPQLLLLVAPGPVGAGARMGRADGGRRPSRAVIIAGVGIGRWTLIAAGAVVTRDVPGFGLVAGVPARRIGWWAGPG
jgi:hypothetical protein